MTTPHIEKVCPTCGKPKNYQGTVCVNHFEADPVEKVLEILKWYREIVRKDVISECIAEGEERKYVDTHEEDIEVAEYVRGWNDASTDYQSKLREKIK